MEKLPITWSGQETGTLTVERQGLYTRFAVSCRLPEEGLWCVWCVGDRGELRIGVPEPRGDRAVIVRSFSDLGLETLGIPRQAVLRPAGERQSTLQWRPLRGEDRFRTPWLAEQLRGLGGVLTARQGENRYLAVPVDTERPFPLVRLFCLARICPLEQGRYAVFTFDREEQPVLSGHGE